jgi:transcription antitermination protein NusB
MLGRRRAREIAMQLLYRDELNKERSLVKDLEFVANRMSGDRELVEFTQSLLRGTRSRIEEVDEKIKSVLQNWSISRMTATDRSILRLAVYEMFFEDTPAEVVINESIEIAKRYGDSRSGGFVNGILDRLHRESTGKQAPGEALPGKSPVEVRHPIRSTSLASRLARKGTQS